MIGDRIRMFRKQKGLSQAQVALRLNVTQGAISQWESGLTKPTAEQIPPLARILDVTYEELLDDEHAENEQIKTPNNDKKQNITKLSQLDTELAEMLVNLRPENIQRVKDFIKGMQAANKT